MMAIIIAYKIKFSGLNPLRWSLDPDHDMQHPPPHKADLPRPSVLELDTPDYWFTWKNLVAFWRWLWVSVIKI